MLMFVLFWRREHYLPIECALAIPPLIAFGIGYIFVIAGMVQDLTALRGVLLFLLLSPGIAVYLRHHRGGTERR